MVENCRLCGAPLMPTGKKLYCSAEHRFIDSLRRLEAAATAHYSINPVEIEQEGSMAHEALDRRLEIAIREIVAHSQGRCEESLVDWFLGLKLTIPDLVHPSQLTEVFGSLSEAGVIELQKPGVGPFSGDETFFLGPRFTVILKTPHVSAGC